MNRRIIITMCITSFILANLTACVKTPEEKIVTDKKKGSVNENIIPTSKDPKELDIPEHWTDTIEKSDGFVTIHADYEMNIPEIYNTPVYAYEMKKLSNQELQRLCDYFSEGNQIYRYPKMSKNELKKEQEKIENFQGRWANFEVIASAPNVQNMFKQLDEMVAQAPDKKETPQYVTAKWETPYQTERDKFNGQSDFYYDTKDKIGLSVRVDKGRNVDPVIRAVNYDTKAGSVTRFQYQEGTYIDERTIERLDAGSEEDPPEYKSWVEKLKNKISGEPEITEDEAQKKAEQVLKELDITGMKLQECVRAAGSTETESWGMLDEECETETGYSMYFYRTEGNLIGYETTYSDVYGDSSKIPETVYAPKFGTESIQMIITKNGIKKFRWNNISVKKEKIAGNTKLLPFNKIKEKLAQHILYMQISDGGEQTKKEGLKFTYEIRDVKLRLGNISAYEDPKSVWLVPVWVFEMDRSWEYKEQVNKESLPFEVTLNAIDGGYIEIE